MEAVVEADIFLIIPSLHHGQEVPGLANRRGPWGSVCSPIGLNALPAW